MLQFKNKFFTWHLAEAQGGINCLVSLPKLTFPNVLNFMLTQLGLKLRSLDNPFHRKRPMHGLIVIFVFVFNSLMQLP